VNWVEGRDHKPRSRWHPRSCIPGHVRFGLVIIDDEHRVVVADARSRADDSQRPTAAPRPCAVREDEGGEASGRPPLTFVLSAGGVSRSDSLATRRASRSITPVVRA
jgi:hypothetical protein